MKRFTYRRYAAVPIEKKLRILYVVQKDLPLKQLQETICEKHRILDPSSIVMVIDGEVLDLLESAEVSFLIIMGHMIIVFTW